MIDNRAERMLPMKDKTLAYILCVLGFGFAAGLHRFYLGKWGTGLLWLFTGGLLWIGTIVDLFLLSGMIDDINEERGWS